MSQETAPFSKWRSFFWPVYTPELKKVLPMLLILFCVAFNYTVLRDTKDSLVVTSSGAETIPFLKFWGVLPAAALFMLIYSKMSNVLSKEKLFYATIAPFLIFFGMFSTVFYPLRETLHPTAFADYLQSVLPLGLAGLVSCLRYWTFSLFYIMSELWGSAVLSLLFWGFANEICKVSEAKRFYTLFSLGGNVSLLISGPMVIYFSNIRSRLPADVDAWQVSLHYLMAAVVILGLVMVATYYWMQRNVLTDPRFYDPEKVKGKKSKPKLSMKESIGMLFKSKYLLCIALLVISYGVSINLVEVTWKGQLKLQYPNPNEYNAFMGTLSTFTGFFTIIMLLIGGSIIRTKGWGFSAMVTPIILLATGLAFFSFVIFKVSLTDFIAYLGTTPLYLAVIIGMIQNVMSKSTKYSLFDPTKEMAYIPLDQDSKVKGKAAIDVVAARFGKSGGSLIQQGLLVVFGSVGAITPYVAGSLMAIMFVWMGAVRSLNKQFLALTGETKKEKAPQPVASSTPAVETAAS